MAEEREHMKSEQVARSDDDDVEGHVDVPRLDETDPELAKLKLANDEDDDVEAHDQHPYQGA